MPLLLLLWRPLAVEMLEKCWNTLHYQITFRHVIDRSVFFSLGSVTELKSLMWWKDQGSFKWQTYEDATTRRRGFSHQLARTASMSLTKFWAKQIPKICGWIRKKGDVVTNVWSELWRCFSPEARVWRWPAAVRRRWRSRRPRSGCPVATSQTVARSLWHWCNPSAPSPAWTKPPVIVYYHLTGGKTGAGCCQTCRVSTTGSVAFIIPLGGRPTKMHAEVSASIKSGSRDKRRDTYWFSTNVVSTLSVYHVLLQTKTTSLIIWPTWRQFATVWSWCYVAEGFIYSHYWSLFLDRTLTAGSLVQHEKGTPHFSRLGFPSVQLK